MQEPGDEPEVEATQTLEVTTGCGVVVEAVQNMDEKVVSEADGEGNEKLACASEPENMEVEPDVAAPQVETDAENDATITETETHQDQEENPVEPVAVEASYIDGTSGPNEDMDGTSGPNEDMDGTTGLDGEMDGTGDLNGDIDGAGGLNGVANSVPEVDREEQEMEHDNDDIEPAMNGDILNPDGDVPYDDDDDDDDYEGQLVVDEDIPEDNLEIEEGETEDAPQQDGQIVNEVDADAEDEVADVGELDEQEDGDQIEHAEDDDIDGTAQDDSEFYATDPPKDGEETEDSLPQCRLKRNYNCPHCGFFTQNPREHLYHLRNEHGEKIRVFECPKCIYASKNQQKLIRHAKMVHKIRVKPEESSSPVKKKSKSPRNSVSPSKSPRRSTSVSPGVYDPADDEDTGYDEDETDNGTTSPSKSDDKGIFHCEQCKFTCKSRKLLNRHETTYHLKRKFFRCQKCNYVTHLKGRYTKHMKYHQLPIIKCDWCDFRTPYRWNLDRHMKNHTEDCGEYKCHLCNFSAQIKQSLTVHISNHHLTPEQIREREMKRTIGISDPGDTIDDEEMELLRMEREEDMDALGLTITNGKRSRSGSDSFEVSNIDMDSVEDLAVNDSEEPKKKKPKIKITLKKMKVPKDPYLQELNERHNFEEDFIHPDDVVHRHGNVYIKTLRCRFCSFKAAFKNEVLRHEKKIHGIPFPKGSGMEKKKKVKKSKFASPPPLLPIDDDGGDMSYKLPSLLLDDPDSLEENGHGLDLLSILNSAVQQSSMEDSHVPISLEETPSNSPPPEDETTSYQNSEESDSKESSPSKESGKKNKSSFFDRLQEKLSTSNVQNLVCQHCGHESKCLSESVRHQKLHLSVRNSYTSSSLSTRCQFCRQRCKTTDDLVNHLKLCPEARKNQIMDTGKRSPESQLDEDNDEETTTEDPGKEDPMQDQDEEAETQENSNVEKSVEEEPLEEDEPCVEEESESMEGVTNETDKTQSSEEKDLDDVDKHPMENRVFVWNNINVDELQEDCDRGDNGSECDGSDRSKTPSDAGSMQGGDYSNSSLQDGLDFIEGPPPTGKYFHSKRVYRCPQCSFWSTTASRFHVHVVGHFNKKPYNCSECGYRSNWRWDITKHIKLKMTRDNSHQNARLVITDETGEKNYEKYDQYVTIIHLDESNAHKTEGGIPARKGRPKKTPEKEEGSQVSSNSTPETTPVKKPPMVQIPTARLPGPPRLTRAPSLGRGRVTPGPMPFGPILPGAQMMMRLSNLRPPSRPPPPLTMRGSAVPSTLRVTSPSSKKQGKSQAGKAETPPQSGASGQYQIITPQGAVTTSLETLQLLAAGSTNLAKLKPRETNKEEEPDVSITPQMKLLVLMSQLAQDWEHKVSVASTNEEGSEVATMVLDHEGNPEWKCNMCDFRDPERDTINKHVKLAHGSRNLVSLLHAVHKCDICGFSAGTKRDVQAHIDMAHAGKANIISKSVGQNPEAKDDGIDPDNAEYKEATRTYHCRFCPFTSKKRSETKQHLSHHVPRSDWYFKCLLCPYYVPTKNDLQQHITLHGTAMPQDIFSPASNVDKTQEEVKRYVCQACPFDTRSRAKYLYHRQFHKPRGLPFKCPHCSYNVTRRHLLSQHLKVHGVSTEVDENGENNRNDDEERSNSPSPSLTITPVTSTSVTKNDSTLMEGRVCNLTVKDEETMHLEDIPLVWVSKDSKFFKMFKCRHCPHVNLRKTNIQEHEKMHRQEKPSNGYKCPKCSYVSANAGVMSAHIKVHGGSMGQCHLLADSNMSDEDQLKKLAAASTSVTITDSSIMDAIKKLSSSSRPLIGAPEPGEMQNQDSDEKVLYYCQQCPARFSFEKEIQIHSKFHGINLPHRCEHCNYGGRQKPHLLAHMKVHTAEYQDNTKNLMKIHPPSRSHGPCDLTLALASPSVENDTNCRVAPPVASPPPGLPMKKFKCDKCPSSFSKAMTLQYHQSLHGAENPYKCHKCNYASKSEDNLQQHEQLHTEAEAAIAAAVTTINVTTTSAPSVTITTASAGVTAIPVVSEGSRSSNSLPPIKLKLKGLRSMIPSSSQSDITPFRYHTENLNVVPISGLDLFKRKSQMEKETARVHKREEKEEKKREKAREKEGGIDDAYMREGNVNLNYPVHIDRVTGKSREKRYKCRMCPSAFEKVDQYNVHVNLHGTNHKYKCRICDYSVKFYANFMMHINRHRYHEKVNSEKYGTPLPAEEPYKYEPEIIVNGAKSLEKGSKMKSTSGAMLMEESANKENSLIQDDPEMTTAEKQHLILQHKKVDNRAIKEEDKEKERRVYYCQYCPYANIRRDAVDSHSLRHQANGGYGVYRCTYCDYTASQPNFIKEHTKVHFRPFRYVHPEGYMRNDRQELLSYPVSASRGTPGPSDESRKIVKHMAFGCADGKFHPVSPFESEEVDSQEESGIKVNFYSGDIVEAPTDFVIALRPVKSKSALIAGIHCNINNNNVVIGVDKSGEANSRRSSTDKPESEGSQSGNLDVGSDDMDIDGEDSNLVIDETREGSYEESDLCPAMPAPLQA
ncbi:uncharacterized protein LOC143025351 isoform X2 [Oratosquilla oratoria]|uniref:uncharacterized protein LOC143025351 isoform X2 n=1 Tax=Oratosquilla oratoria TaxID=337810 RepID=UPI003F7692FC